MFIKGPAHSSQYLCSSWLTKFGNQFLFIGAKKTRVNSRAVSLQLAISQNLRPEEIFFSESQVSLSTLILGVHSFSLRFKNL